MTKIYFDMDGVLAEFQKEKSIEEVAQPGYFRTVKVMENMFKAFMELYNDPGFDVKVLSSVLHKTAAEDKFAWLQTLLDNQIRREDCIFVPYGEKKSDYILNPSVHDVLIDDFSLNLHQWHGIGIKCLNGINGTKGSWNGYVVKSSAKPHIIRRTIVGIIYAEQAV